MKAPKYKLFMQIFEQWRIRLGLPCVKLVKDNRISGRAELVSWEDDTCTLRINARRVGILPECRVILDALHELGHLLYDLDYDSKEERLESEYQAELFAIRMMKHHYPIEYKNVCNDMHSRLYGDRKNSWKKRFPTHIEAFEKIKDYKVKRSGDGK